MDICFSYRCAHCRNKGVMKNGYCKMCGFYNEEEAPVSIAVLHGLDQQECLTDEWPKTRKLEENFTSNCLATLIARMKKFVNK